MLNEFLQYGKQHGFKVRSKAAKVFKQIGQLEYFIELHTWDSDSLEPNFSAEFGIKIQSPFERTLSLHKHSILSNQFCYGGGVADRWPANASDQLFAQLDAIALPWLAKHQQLDELIEYLLWHIRDGIRWYESEPHREFYSKQPELVQLMGGSGHKICHEWVKRYYKDLAIVALEQQQTDKAKIYLNQYLNYIKPYKFRAAECQAIEAFLQGA